MRALVPGDPRQLGEYWLAGRLGEGGQGVVYEAYDPAGQRVAIKVLHPGAGAELRLRFAKEAAATRQVSAFCTARVLSVRLDDPRPYIVSEYVGGPSLRRAVESAGPYRPDDLHRLATGIATALTAIHEAGVIHRDLKPDNVLIGPDGPRVIDFGIARTSEMSLTPTGQNAGTPAFMAPESVIGERAGPAVDIWAWGAVVLYAATGRDPFTGENLAGLLHQILAAVPDVSGLAEPLRTLVTAALAKDPADRPSSRGLLLALVGGQDVTPREDGGTRALLTEGSRAAEVIRPPARLAPPPLELVAEQIYRRLRGTDQAVVPQIMLRLVMPGEGAEDMLRKVPAGELDDGVVDPPMLDRVLLGFTRAELVVRDDDTVSLANAALLRAWPRMRGWIDADRAGLRIHRRLGEAAQRWDAHGRRPGDLYQGGSLEAALSWAATGRQHVTLNLVENAFLEAGLAHSRVRARRRRQVMAALATMLVIALAATGVAAGQRAAAVRERDIAVARKTAMLAETLQTSDPVRAMLLSVAAWRIAPVQEARAVLYSALAQRELTVLPPPAAGADARFDLSADGRVLAVADAGQVTLRETGRPVRTVAGVGTDVRAIALSGDQAKVVVCGPDTVRVWDVATGRPGPRIAGTALGATLSRDGRLLGLATTDGRGEVRDVRTGERVMGTRDERIDRITISDDDRYAAATFTDGRYELWELGSRRRIRGSGSAVAFGPGTAAIATGGEIRLWDLAAGRFRRESLVDGITAAWLSFSADGRLLISYDRAAIAIWDVATGEPTLHYPLTDTSGMPSARLDAGHTRLSYLLGRGAVAVLDLTMGVHVAASASAAAFDRAGRFAALQTERGLVLWDVAAGRSLGPLDHRDSAASTATTDADADGAYALAFSPDGRTLAAGSDGTTTVTLWDVASRTETARLPIGGRQYIDGLAFSPDGRTLVVAPARGRAERWDVRRAQRLPDLPRDGFDAMAVRPDGKTLVIGGSDAALIDLAAGNVIRDRPFGGSVDGVRSLAYSPDGSTIAVGFRQLGVDLWDGLGRRQLGRLAPGRGEFDTVMAIAFHPAGAILATGGSSGRVQLWDVAARTALGDSFKAHAGGVLTLGFSGDGRRLLSIGDDGTIHDIPVDPAAAVARICARAGVGLAQADWERFIPEISFREVC
ncbi:WD40 repeat domain-containing serine/threonine protein kinase [Nonomuraea guangzhouensis]|uniref:WD40 repeat domain-containing serine/threonine protein kinase n=1 Tax=Nonomuraea guangzhouensis TaxID=1291555 RepID=A0ABW4GEX4_9ACTN|nr:serine/threonine-protein kinase [Nonomuraea guangzhouensis]